MVRSFCQTAAFLCLLVTVAGCSSEDGFTSDVAGKYTVAITNENDSCGFQNWEEGKETSGIELDITQNGTDLHGTLGGVTGAFFALAFGSAEFDGSIHGTSFELDNYGTRSSTSGNCVYTYNATVKGAQNGDSISGSIIYSSKTNGNPDCEAVQCAASQKFSGSRPPK